MTTPAIWMQPLPLNAVLSPGGSDILCIKRRSCHLLMGFILLNKSEASKGTNKQLGGDEISPNSSWLIQDVLKGHLTVAQPCLQYFQVQTCQIRSQPWLMFYKTLLLLEVCQWQPFWFTSVQMSKDLFLTHSQP